MTTSKEAKIEIEIKSIDMANALMMKKKATTMMTTATATTTTITRI
jgi:hypothetical protein